jgi:hypothetical protein
MGPLLWEAGSMVDLNTLIPPDSLFYLFSTSFIDDRGRIVAFGALPNGDMHAVLLIPCDEEHSDVEGCDYGLVGAASAAQRRVADRMTLVQQPGSRRFAIRQP